MAFLANTLAGAHKVSMVVVYSILFLVLAADFWFHYATVNRLNFGTKVLLGGGWTSLPVFFSGVVFSSSLQRFGRPAEMMGVNLFGAVLGGLLENAVMIGGTPILKVLALLMYVASAITLLSSPFRLSDPAVLTHTA